MRGAFAAAVIEMGLAILTGEPNLALAQAGFDRPGGDYAQLVVSSGNPEICATQCERDERCKAWSFSYPQTDGHKASCWLKSKVPRRAKNSCCVSGVRGAAVIAPPFGEVEFSVDRRGSDYRSFKIAPDPTGRVCASACRNDSKCRAWTYLRPGYVGLSARCYLKGRIRVPHHRPCCLSGVVR